MVDFTTVIGVDAHHLRELEIVWPTWRRWRPELFENPLVVFHDRELAEAEVARVVVADHPNVKFVTWPAPGVTYPGTPGKRWEDPQRAKMLAGFVHVPATHVFTPYWLKIDTDCVAFRSQFPLAPDSAFDSQPAIIAHPWGYTKPADQMVKLDEWVDYNDLDLPDLAAQPPLRLVPEPGAKRINHRRIISFCAFFQARFTCYAAQYARDTCPAGQLPVPSQDGYLFYVAKRLGAGIILQNMKQRGWEHWGNFEALRRSVWRSLNDEV